MREKLINGVDLFSELKPSAKAILLADLVEHKFQAKHTIMTKGEIGSSMYIIGSGDVQIHDGDIRLAELHASDYFGEFSLLDNRPRSLSVSTIGEVVAFELHQSAFYNCLRENPDTIEHIIRMLIKRLRERNARMLRDLREREEVLSSLVDERTHKLNLQTQLLEKKNKEVLDSIHYAKRHQDARMPSLDSLSKDFADSFILYKPKDIVAGDFFWFKTIRSTFIVTAADCTGHGVAGALMSMLGLSLLDQIVSESEIMEPGKILNSLHSGVIEALHQDETDGAEGMDLALCAFHKGQTQLEFSGANRPLWIVRNGEVIIYNSDKMPIGGLQIKDRPSYSTQKIEIHKGDMVYLFTDGYADQFGGELNKKMMRKRLKGKLLDIAELDGNTQKLKLDEYFNSWKSDEEQVDDVLIIGLRVS